MSSRIERDEMFMQIARVIAMRSTCERAQVGAVAVVGDRIRVTGYGGSPSGEPHCLDIGCDVRDDHCVRTIHAEANVIAWAAREGLSVEEGTLYCTHKPCLQCAKLIVNAGFYKVVYLGNYGNNDGIELLKRQELYVEQYVPTP